MKWETGGLNESLHAGCSPFLCLAPERQAARWVWDKNLNPPEKRAVGTDIWMFLPGELAMQ